MDLEPFFGEVFLFFAMLLHKFRKVPVHFPMRIWYDIYIKGTEEKLCSEK